MATRSGRPGPHGYIYIVESYEIDGFRYAFKTAEAAVAWAYDGEGPESEDTQREAVSKLVGAGRVRAGPYHIEELEIEG